MNLDAMTLWCTIAAAAIVIGGLQVVQFLINRSETAMLLWGIAKLTGAVGAALLAVREIVPDLLSVTVGNALIVLAVSIDAAGVVAFNVAKISRTVLVLPLVVMLVGFLSVPTINSDIAMQTYINGVCVSAVLGWAAVHAHRANSRERLVWRRGLAAVLWTWVATMGARMVSSIWIPDATNPVGSSPVQSITALILLALVVMIGVVEMLASRERVDRKLAQSLRHDHQTGALNRAGLAVEVEQLTSKADRAAVLLIDIDDFKAINDTAGHLAGDAALVDLTDVVRPHLGARGILARFGGDEFCVVIPGADLDAAVAVAEAIRDDVNDVRRSAASSAGFTVSIGISVGELHQTEAFDRMLSSADGALYEAKRSGRNAVRACSAAGGRARAESTPPASAGDVMSS
ncbi:sensor domain-containing diguanylate cyclase [Gordonia phthalatica]|nr:GGDEF domain-containing protein [Gordonia phthalatica]